MPDEQLPVVLPVLEDFAPSGDGRSAGEGNRVAANNVSDVRRPGRTRNRYADTYICSSWYELRYFDPKNAKKPFDPAVANTWIPIDFYNGGDHATAHPPAIRTVYRAIFPQAWALDDPEPFKKFLFNGKVKASDGSAFSKSKGNGVDPL